MNDPKSTAGSQPALARWVSPRRWRFWAILVLVVYTVGGFFGAPWLLENIATRKVAEIDRTLSFGDIKVNPFLLTLQMRDTNLQDSDGVSLFAFDDYFIDLQSSSLFRRAWTFKEIRLAGLQLNWERYAPGDDRFGRLIDSFPAAEDPETETSPVGLPRLVIHQLNIAEARAHLTDTLEHLDFKTEFGPINIQATNLSTLPDDAGQQEVHITTRAGGVIAWQGSVQLSPLHSTGKVTVQGPVLADYDQYLALFTAAKLQRENVDASFSYKIQQVAGQPIDVAIEDLNVLLREWQLFLPDEPEAFVSLPELQITGGDFHWPQQTLNLAKVSLQQPGVRLVRAADGSLNLDKLLAEFAGDQTSTETSPEPDDAATTGTPWKVSVARFVIEQGNVDFEDSSTEPAAQVGLQDINVAVTDISNQEAASLPVQASLTLASGGSLNFDGQAVLLPEFSSSGQLTLDGLQLPLAQPWVNDIARVTVNSGNVSLNGQVEISPQQAGAFQGSLTIRELDVNDNLHQEKLTGWKQLHIDRLEADLAANTLETSELAITEPYGRLQIAADHTTNLDGLMIETSEDAAAENIESETPALAITMAGFKIEDASLDFSDLTLPLPFAAAIRSMDGTISTLATQSEEPARVSLEGQVNEFSLARISGSLNAWSPVSFTDIQMTFRNLEMERMTPYTIEFAGWEIDAGRMDLELDYKINQGQLNGANDVVIRELTVGDKVESPTGTSLPLKFAVALLKDSNGVIDVDLPVEGSLNDPSFRIGGIVWKAIGNLLAKVATAPFRLLGSLVGVDSEDFGTLRFSAGLAEISPPDREQLVKLAEAMRQRPELRLEVAGTYAVSVDKPAIQTRQVDERIEQGVASLQSSGDSLITEQRRQVMEQMVAQSAAGLDLIAMQQEFSKIPEGEDPEKATALLDETAYLEALRQRLIAAEPVSDEALQALANARADAVLAQLAGDGSTSPLPLTQQPAVAVEAAENDEVPLELKVEAGADSAGS